MNFQNHSYRSPPKKIAEMTSNFSNVTFWLFSTLSYITLAIQKAGISLFPLLGRREASIHISVKLK